MVPKFLQNIVNRIRGHFPISELVKRGLVLGNNVKILEQVILDPMHCWLIEIGDNVVIAPKVHILAHDASSIRNKATRIGFVKIGKDTFIGASSIILPGVTIGENVVIGAGSVVTHDIPSNSIAVGNPVRIVGTRTASEMRHKDNIKKYPSYQWPSWGIEGGITKEQKDKMRNDLKDSKYGYLVL